MTFPMPIVAPYKTPPSVDFLGTLNNTGAASSYTFSGVNFGAPSPTRIIAILIGSVRANSGNASFTATIGGVTATIMGASYNGNGSAMGAAYAVVPAGTTGDIVINYSGTLESGTGGMACFPYRIDGMLSSVPTIVGDGSPPLILPITCPINSAIAGIGVGYRFAPVTWSWSGPSGTTENADIKPGSGFHASAASLLSQSALSGDSLQATPTDNNAAQAYALIFS